MHHKTVLVFLFLFFLTVFFFASPSRGCSVRSECNVYCSNAAGQVVDNQTCTDQSGIGYSGSCECYTDAENDGYAHCHSHCSSTTGQDKFCDQLL